MSTRYAYTPNISQNPAIHVEETSTNEPFVYFAEAENSVVLTGNSTPTGIQETGSWVAVSPNTHLSDSDFEAYHADNDDDPTFDSPGEDPDEAPGNESLNANGELDDLRASLSTLLATAAYPKFRQPRVFRVNHNFLPVDEHSPTRQPYDNVTIGASLRQSVQNKDEIQHSERNLSETPVTANTNDSLDMPPEDSITAPQKSTLTPPIIHDHTNTTRRRGTITPPLLDKAQAMIERSFNFVHPRLVYSAPVSPPSATFVVGNPSGTNRRFNPKTSNSDIYAAKSPSHKSKNRKSSKRSSHNGSVSPFSLGGKSDETSESSSSSTEEKRKINSKGNESQHRNGVNNDDSRWFTGDITVKLWTAAFISGVLLGAGFGAGTIWRSRGGGHYATASA